MADLEDAVEVSLDSRLRPVDFTVSFKCPKLQLMLMVTEGEYISYLLTVDASAVFVYHLPPL